jgi:pimeloyl-ACP methyl ester carboxylesterase
MRWLRNIAFLVLGLVALLAAAGATFQFIANRADARRFPEPGRMVDLRGFRLKLNCTGTGSPTVVLESGFGDVLPEWQSTQQGIANFARVCSYDRAGYGGSDAGTMPRTSTQIAEELHSLLHNAGENPPFVLVGHSFGGYNVRVFHGQFPNEVVGLVLVDSVQEDQYQLLPPDWQRVLADLAQHCRRQARLAPFLVDLGIGRLMLRAKGSDENSYLILQSKYLDARASEIENVYTSAEQARASGTFGDKPLIVLTAGQEPSIGSGLTPQDVHDYQRIWVDDLQLRLARLSSRGKRELITDSSHDIPSDRPDAIVNAVQEVRAAATAH